MKNTSLFLLLLVSLVVSCKKEEASDDVSSANPNILFIIADDLGKDATPGFLTDVSGLTKANMPVLDSLRNRGVKFVNFWATPVCAPTRAALLTAKYGIDNGVLRVGDHIATSETTIQKFLDNNATGGYATAIFGKWHISNNYSDPNTMGIDHFAGVSGGGVSDYYDWDLIVNGGTATKDTTYITTKLTDLAIEWLNNQNSPWFLWMAYNAPHTPFHEPPSNLHTRSSVGTDQEKFLAAAEALDTEVGRLISSVSPSDLSNTLIIYIADNGSPSGVSQRYEDTKSNRTKGSIYQGGVNVPMVASGYGVSRINEVDSSLINATDFFATIADIANTGIDTINSGVSFKGTFSNEGKGRREYAYTEIDDGSGGNAYTIRDERYKLMRLSNGNVRYYDLWNDPFEESSLTNGAGLTSDQISDTTNLVQILNTIRN